MKRIVRPGGSVVLPKHEAAEEVYEALLQLDWDNAEEWDNGRPKLDLVNSLLASEQKVTQKLVDDVFDALVVKVKEIVGGRGGAVKVSRRV